LLPVSVDLGPKPFVSLKPCDPVVERTFPVFYDLLNIRDWSGTRFPLLRFRLSWCADPKVWMIRIVLHLSNLFRFHSAYAIVGQKTLPFVLTIRSAGLSFRRSGVSGTCTLPFLMYRCRTSDFSSQRRVMHCLTSVSWPSVQPAVTLLGVSRRTCCLVAHSVLQASSSSV
jgi:hypothetical protein